MFCRPRVWAGRGTVWPLIIKQKRVADVLIAARLDRQLHSQLWTTTLFPYEAAFTLIKGTTLLSSTRVSNGNVDPRHRRLSNVPVQVTP